MSLLRKTLDSTPRPLSRGEKKRIEDESRLKNEEHWREWLGTTEVALGEDELADAANRLARSRNGRESAIKRLKGRKTPRHVWHVGAVISESDRGSYSNGGDVGLTSHGRLCFLDSTTYGRFEKEWRVVPTPRNNWTPSEADIATRISTLLVRTGVA